MAKELWDVFRELIDTALGRRKADLVIENCNLINVNSGEILEGYGIAVKGGRVALIGDVSHTIGEETLRIDASGMYAAPGLIDAHMHVESSMVSLTQFTRAVLPRGTTTIFIDPHEIGNVLGVDGVKLLIDEARGLPLKVYVTAPSCVPANPMTGDSGAVITPRDIDEMLGWDSVVALGEMMNYPGVLGGDEDALMKIYYTLRHGRPVEGHDPGLLGRELNAYASAGVSSSHELTRMEEVIEHVRLGMYAYLREGSAWLDVEETVKAITAAGIDSRHICLVTDDREIDSILREGHMDHVVRRAIEEGVDPVRAIQMATINPAEHYNLDREIGSIAPSRRADIILFRRLSRIDVDTVIADGRIVARGGRLIIDLAEYRYPEWALRTVNTGGRVEPGDFTVRAPIGEGYIDTRVIEAIEGSVLTRHRVERLRVEDGVVKPDRDRNIYKVGVIDRHRGTGNIGLGLVKGFGFNIGAIASTVAHDSHNLLVLGLDDGDMALAVNKLIESGGGIITVKDGRVLSFIELRLAGLMSIEPMEDVAEKVEEMYRVWRELGCRWVSPFMTISLLALDVLPELRITTRGLIDTVNYRFIGLFPGED